MDRLESLSKKINSLVEYFPAYENGHVGSSNVGYDGTHGGFGYGDRNADGSRILRVCRWAKLSRLQQFVRKAGISVGDICSWSC